MKFKTIVVSPEHKVKTIRSEDPEFIFKAGVASFTRAGFEVSKDCPKEYSQIILDCVKYGWIRPVAYMKQSEYVWETLQGGADE